MIHFYTEAIFRIVNRILFIIKIFNFLLFLAILLSIHTEFFEMYTMGLL